MTTTELPLKLLAPVKEFCANNWQTFVWLILAGLGMTLFWAPFWLRGWDTYLSVAFFMIAQWVGLWLSNSWTSHAVSMWIPWTTAPVKRLVVGMIAMVLVTLVTMFVVIWMAELILGLSFRGGLLETAYYTLTITFIINLFMHGRGFLRNWKNAELNAEKLQKESMKAQYESLKNQVNPHFLFNSLNALTNLVYEDPDKAAKFIKQLSEVYRYVLDTREKELVWVEEELKFLRAFLYLQQIRFGDKLKVDLNLNADSYRVAPLVLQMLLENAIKHNVVSEENPLSIKVYAQDGYLIVENSLQRRKVLPEESAGVGLENIKRRYSFLTDKAVEVIENTQSFIVRLPAI